MNYEKVELSHYLCTIDQGLDLLWFKAWISIPEL
jgi:hypothetical protein